MVIGHIAYAYQPPRFSHLHTYSGRCIIDNIHLFAIDLQVYQNRASFMYGFAKGRPIQLYVNELLPHGLTNQAETFWVGCGRSGERLAKISADSIERKKC